MSNAPAKPRPVYRNIHITDIVRYRLPVAGMVSILHRVSGAMMFLLLPFALWIFDASLSSEFSYEALASAFAVGAGPLPGWLLKLVSLALIWAYLHHAIAGVRHLWMDATHSVAKAQGATSAVATLALSLLLTAALGAKLFGLF
ncbi:MAG TPA: succinate dehydrogenase, cytochrome b556 subunit [Rubrivivax sp.]|jgi:succinate dehydrogenase / fumarate reductase cytochrome b subunit|nr:succinate dehydrogenase, cytochrome b556 subunit [Rubrivivax sp.]